MSFRKPSKKYVVTTTVETNDLMPFVEAMRKVPAQTLSVEAIEEILRGAYAELINTMDDEIGDDMLHYRVAQTIIDTLT